jgi:hypothetical protein
MIILAADVTGWYGLEDRTIDRDGHCDLNNHTYHLITIIIPDNPKEF